MTSPTIWLNEFLPINGDLVQQYSLVVPSILSNKINAAPPIYIRANGIASTLRFDVNNPPRGNDININIYQASTLWFTGSITVGNKTANFNTGGLASLILGNLWRIDIIQVGGLFPGSDLVVTIIV